MSVNTEAIGKEWPATTYTIGSEKIREYASAVGETNPVYDDPDAAKAAGFRDLVAPPMFCVVYSNAAMAAAMLDPEVGIDFDKLVHGEQQFEWGEPVCAGDVITTTATLTEVTEKMKMGFYVFETESTNQDGEQTVLGTWTDIVRGD
jgi:acyl dehydratase